MKLIVGLGNPGKEYENTRHNIGFIILNNYNSDFVWKKDKKALISEQSLFDEKVLFIKPQTFMNLSGEAVAYYANYYKIDAKDILVIHDDLDIDVLTYRIKFDSSDGGHNGIKSIIKSLGTQEFARLKIGIKKEHDEDTISHVLGKLSKSQIKDLKSDIYKEIINSFIKNGIEYTMSKYNKRG